MKTSIRVLAVVFAVAMVICSLVSVSATVFPDVKSDNPYYTAINKMTNLGIIGGYEDGTFKPDGLVRRDEMSKIIFVTATTYIDAGEGEVIFPDVHGKSWAKGYISWCASKNIVAGYEDGSFKPEGNITYDEALKMVCAMLGYTDFSSDMWPIDVRTKALTDLKLGTGLEDVAGNAVLTRAQVVQLVCNALDKPMYQAPVEPDNDYGIIAAKPIISLASTVWDYKETKYQVVATEGYGFKNAEEGIDFAKTESKELIKIIKLDKDGKAIADTEKEVNLSDIGLDSYIGQSDSLIAFHLDVITRGAEDNYISADVLGSRKDGISSGYASTTGVSESELFTYDGDKYVIAGTKLDDVNYYDDNFLDLRRLDFYEDGTVEAVNAHVTDGTYILPETSETSTTHPVTGATLVAGDVINCVDFTDAKGNAGGDRKNHNLAYLLGRDCRKYVSGIDKDGDGWFDYVLVELIEPYRVKTVTSKTITVEHYTVPQWKPVAGHTMTFKKENVTSLTELKAGDAFGGYINGDKLVMTDSSSTRIAYVTKYYSPSNVWTLNNGSTLGGAYYQKSMIAGDMSGKMAEAGGINPFNSSIKPLVGINPDTNDYNYIKFTTIGTVVLWAEQISASEANTSSALDKAILLYVTEATEPQINEETKAYEVYYPAYLVINGRTQLVNLNPEYAIDEFSGSGVARDGSEYRASVVTEAGTGKQRVIYPNILVTYTIDANGYYTLSTKAQTVADKDADGKDEEIVIKANPANTMSIDADTGLITIKTPTQTYSKIITNSSSIIYYPYTKDETGTHEHIEYYKGDEIPSDFAEDTPVPSDIFLVYDKDSGIYVISTLLLGGKLTGSSADVADPAKDAREHLFAITDSEIVAEGSNMYKSYFFKKLYDYTDVEAVNRDKDYNDANEAVAGGIYAWDKVNENYVPAENTWDSIKTEKITEILTDMGVIFTETTFTSGVKISEDLTFIAITNREENEFKTITFDDLVSISQTVDKYNELNEGNTGFTPYTIEATIGVYTEDEKTQIAYIIVDWVEYDEETEAYVFAGEAK